MNGRLMNKKQLEEIILKKIELEDETYYELQDAIVPDALLDSLERTVDEILNLRAIGDDLPPHKKEDLEHAEEYAPALAVVLKWWTVQGSEESERVEELVSCLKKD